MSSDNTGQFFQNRGEQPSWLGNIKEMARQVAALTRTSTYRHGPMPGKDLTYFGNNHSLQTAQLSLNGSLGSSDFSAFKTPPEGRTPVDTKHFDYGEETLKTLEIQSVESQLTVLCDGRSQLNDSGISEKGSLSSVEVEKHCKNHDADMNKTDDDAYLTPPEFQDDNNVHPSSAEVITSVKDKLLNISIDKIEPNSKDIESSTNEQELEDDIGAEKECENTDIVIVEKLTCLEKANSEKDSSDGSPVGRGKFLQEEDDSGISTIDENDTSRDSRDSPTSPNSTGNNFMDRKIKDKTNQKVYSDNYSQRPSGNILEKRTSPSQHELKHSKANNHDAEDGVGWQTRCKRMGRKRNDKEFERRMNYTNYDMEHYGSNDRNYHRDFPRRGIREGKKRERTVKMEKNEGQPYGKMGEISSEDHNRTRENGAWSSRRSEDSDFSDNNSSKRSGRRGGTLSHGGRKSESRWAKNGSREKYIETEKVEQHSGNTPTVASQPNVFSYRDALLKASSSNDTSQNAIFVSKGEKMEFDMHSAARYLLSVWTNVENLRRKDPSKVFIFSED